MWEKVLNSSEGTSTGAKLQHEDKDACTIRSWLLSYEHVCWFTTLSGLDFPINAHIEVFNSCRSQLTLELSWHWHLLHTPLNAHKNLIFHQDFSIFGSSPFLILIVLTLREHQSLHNASWEPFEVIYSQHPTFHLEDKVWT